MLFLLTAKLVWVKKDTPQIKQILEFYSKNARFDFIKVAIFLKKNIIYLWLEN